jgi:hypothetical protein
LILNIIFKCTFDTKYNSLAKYLFRRKHHYLFPVDYQLCERLSIRNYVCVEATLGNPFFLFQLPQRVSINNFIIFCIRQPMTQNNIFVNFL